MDPEFNRLLRQAKHLDGPPPSLHGGMPPIAQFLAIGKTYKFTLVNGTVLEKTVANVIFTLTPGVIPMVDGRQQVVTWATPICVEYIDPDVPSKGTVLNWSAVLSWSDMAPAEEVKEVKN